MVSSCDEARAGSGASPPGAFPAIAGFGLATAAGGTDGTLAALRAGRPLAPAGDPAVPATMLDGWIEASPVSPKNRKFLDRASILLLAAAHPLLPALRAFPPDEVALHLAAGPTRGELEFFTEWDGRDREEAPGPHAALRASEVVRLLPNILVSNLSIALGMRGPNAVFAGFAPAAAAALAAAGRELRAGRAAAALVAAVSSPLNYFNRDAFARHLPADAFPHPLAEGAAAFLLLPPDAASPIGRIADLRELPPDPAARRDPAHQAARIAARWPDLAPLPRVSRPDASGDLLAVEPLLALARALDDRPEKGGILAVAGCPSGSLTAVVAAP